MRLFVIAYYGDLDGDNARQYKFVAADDLPTDDEAQAMLAEGEDTDFTDEVLYVEELDQVWNSAGDRVFDVKLAETT